jgi:hypothetical protein
MDELSQNVGTVLTRRGSLKVVTKTVEKNRMGILCKKLQQRTLNNSMAALDDVFGERDRSRKPWPPQ